VLSQHAMIGNTRVRWEEQGEGIPVVFIHGIPTSPALWRHVIPSVKGARCLAFEMVGYGDSIGEGAKHDISVVLRLITSRPGCGIWTSVKLFWWDTILVVELPKLRLSGTRTSARRCF
jgi:pimeloyl-ACP methyl ester carboxylesterase